MSLNWKAYVNILLVIVIITLILHNVNVDVTFGALGTREEHRYDDSPPKGYESDDSDVEFGDMQSELEKYADKIAFGDSKEQMNKQSVARGVDNKEQFYGMSGGATFPKMAVKPENYFGDLNNVSNFSSNVMDINKFYSNSFGDIEFRTPYAGQAGAGQLSAAQTVGADYVDAMSKSHSFVNDKSSDGTKTFKADTWKYKNENVMNGGDLFNGVSGFDGMDNGLAVFNSAPIMSNVCGDVDKYGRDDLRMGMGAPARGQRETR